MRYKGNKISLNVFAPGVVRDLYVIARSVYSLAILLSYETTGMSHRIPLEQTLDTLTYESRSQEIVLDSSRRNLVSSCVLALADKGYGNEIFLTGVLAA